MVARPEPKLPAGTRTVKEVDAIMWDRENPSMCASTKVFEAVRKAVENDMLEEGHCVKEHADMVAGNIYRRLEMLTIPYAMMAVTTPPTQNEDGSYSGLTKHPVCEAIGKKFLGSEVWACLNTEGGLTLVLASEWADLEGRSVVEE